MPFQNPLSPAVTSVAPVYWILFDRAHDPSLQQRDLGIASTQMWRLCWHSENGITRLWSTMTTHPTSLPHISSPKKPSISSPASLHVQNQQSRVIYWSNGYSGQCTDQMSPPLSFHLSHNVRRLYQVPTIKTKIEMRVWYSPQWQRHYPTW